MRALLFKSYGGPEVMELGEAPEPQLGLRDVKVRIHAAGINPIDYKIRNGALKHVLHYNMPLTPGFDASGVVTEVGLRARHFKEGDSVYAYVQPGRIGTFADFIAIDRSDVAPMPESLNFEQAAGVPLAALTAWQTLVDIIKLQAGQEILIHAGAGGVGTFTIQFAKHMGARVTTTASAAKHALLSELGADICVDYTSTDFVTLGPKFDAVFDTVGGSVLLSSFRVVKPGGKVASIVSLPDDATARRMGLGFIQRMGLRFAQRKVTAAASAARAEYRFAAVQPSEAQLRRIGELIDQGHVRPIIDSIYPFERFREAFAKLEAGHATGKIVLRIQDVEPVQTP